MQMLFTWDTNNLCIVFRSWRVTGTWSLIGWLVAVIALTAGYELVREASRRFEDASQKRIEGLPTSKSTATHKLQSEKLMRLLQDGEELSSLPWSGRNARTEEQRAKIVKAALYGLQVFYSFFIM